VRPIRPGRRAAGRTLLAGAGALGLLVIAGGTANADSPGGPPTPGASSAAVPAGKVAASCIGDAQGMMTMPNGMKMPAAQMPGCSAATAGVGAATAKATPATAPKVSAAPTAAKPAPAGSIAGMNTSGSNMGGPHTGGGPNTGGPSMGGQVAPHKMPGSAGAPAAAPQKAPAAAGAAAPTTPKLVHAGTGGQASEDQSTGLPVAPLAMVLGGLGIAAVAGRQLRRD
jgi:hypothetical protein